MNRRQAALKAKRVRLKDAVPYAELREELIAFKDKWHIKPHYLGDAIGVKRATVNYILYSTDQFVAVKETSDAIRSGIRDYDPRTCQYRRFPKAEIGEWLIGLRTKHNVNWKELSVMLDYPYGRIRAIAAPGSNQHYVSADTVRYLARSYNKWLQARNKDLA